MIVDTTNGYGGIMNRTLIKSNIIKDAYSNNIRRYCVYVNIGTSKISNTFMSKLSKEISNDGILNVILDFSCDKYIYRNMYSLSIKHDWNCIEVICDDIDKFLDSVNGFKLNNILPDTFDVVMVYESV